MRAPAGWCRVLRRPSSAPAATSTTTRESGSAARRPAAWLRPPPIPPTATSTGSSRSTSGPWRCTAAGRDRALLRLVRADDHGYVRGPGQALRLLVDRLDLRDVELLADLTSRAAGTVRVQDRRL